MRQDIYALYGVLDIFRSTRNFYIDITTQVQSLRICFVTKHNFSSLNAGISILNQSSFLSVFVRIHTSSAMSSQLHAVQFQI